MDGLNNYTALAGRKTIYKLMKFREIVSLQPLEKQIAAIVSTKPLFLEMNFCKVRIQ